MKGLFTRFDSRALRAAPASELGPLPSAPLPRTTALEAWCHQGSGPGGTSLWTPWALPRVQQRLALALVDDGPATALLLEALARQLDGELRLRALPGAAARWALKLGVKAQDACWWRARRCGDIWDSGYLADDPAVRAQLPHFRPRRATLMLADPMPLATLQQTLLPLAERQAHFAHPVRVLVRVPAALAAAWCEQLAAFQPARLPGAEPG